MYMPYAAPSDLGEMLQGWVTLLFVGIGFVAGLAYAPLSNVPIAIALICWGLAAIQVHRMEDDGEIQSRRMKLLGILAFPMLLLFLNGLVDTHPPVKVDAIVGKVRFAYSRRGTRVVDIHPQHPVAGFDVLHSRASLVDSISPGMPAQVYYHPGALGLPWGMKVDLHPPIPSESGAP